MDIRWKQRFENYKRAYGHVKELCRKSEMTEIENVALIKFFELAFELAWKTLKDLLEEDGIISKTPRSVIKDAAQTYEVNGHALIKMLEVRNEEVHLYDEEQALKAAALIKSEFEPALGELLRFLGERSNA